MPLFSMYHSPLPIPEYRPQWMNIPTLSSSNHCSFSLGNCSMPISVFGIRCGGSGGTVPALAALPAKTHAEMRRTSRLIRGFRLFMGRFVFRGQGAGDPLVNRVDRIAVID